MFKICISGHKLAGRLDCRLWGVGFRAVECSEYVLRKCEVRDVGSVCCEVWGACVAGCGM